MKNLFQSISQLAGSVKKNVISKTTELAERVRGKVALLTTAIALGVSSPAIAEDWHKVTDPGMGPLEFVKKNFGTSNWRDLVDKKGNAIRDPRTDLKFQGKYTLRANSQRTSQDQVKKVTISTQAPTNTTPLPKAKKDKTPSDVPKALQKEEKPRNVFSGISYDQLMSLDGFRDFNMRAYNQAIAQYESNGGNIHARNDKIGRRYRVNPRKFAFGWPQFTVETLETYGIQLMKDGKIIEEHVQKFLRNKPLQDNLMEQYTKQTLTRIQKSPKMIELIVNGKISLPAVLAKGHIAGQGSIMKSAHGEDWLGTKAGDYVHSVESAYKSLARAELAERENIQVTRSSPEKIQGEIVATLIPNTQIAANDDHYNIEQSSNISRISSVVAEVKKAAMKTHLEETSDNTSNAKYKALSDKKTQVLAQVTKLEARADRLNRDVASIINDGLGKRRIMRDAKIAQEEATKLRKYIHDIERVLLAMKQSQELGKAA